MRIIGGSLYILRIPFVETFSHSAKVRTYSDSIVIRLVADDGTIGYGEGVPRPYVTGETVEGCVDHMLKQLWPAIVGIDYPDLRPDPDPIATLALVDATLPEPEPLGVIAWHAARTAFELALIDTALQRQHVSLAAILPPKRSTITYSGIIGAGSIQKAVQVALSYKAFGLRHFKVKIGEADARERIAAIRHVVGPSVSLRVDANGAYTVPQALAILVELAEFAIESAEQPIARGDPAALALVRARSPIPVMADESLVTLADAQTLIDAHACDFFNLRVSKCGGIGRTLEMAQMAARSGLRTQLGCQVGETGILSAAGRHVAAYLSDLMFVEGSFGSLLLKEDVGEDSINFGYKGEAAGLREPGLGIRVREDRLRTYAETIITLGKD